MNDKKTPANKGLTYADSGVDINAGNDFVQAIKPLIKSTRSHRRHGGHWRVWRTV